MARPKHTHSRCEVTRSRCDTSFRTNLDRAQRRGRDVRVLLAPPQPQLHVTHDAEEPVPRATTATAATAAAAAAAGATTGGERAVPEELALPLDLCGGEDVGT